MSDFHRFKVHRIDIDPEIALAPAERLSASVSVNQKLADDSASRRVLLAALVVGQARAQLYRLTLRPAERRTRVGAAGAAQYSYLARGLEPT